MIKSKVIISRDKESGRIKIRVKTGNQLFFLGFLVDEIRKSNKMDYYLYIDDNYFGLIVIEEHNLEILDGIEIK